MGLLVKPKKMRTVIYHHHHSVAPTILYVCMYEPLGCVDTPFWCMYTCFEQNDFVVRIIVIIEGLQLIDYPHERYLVGHPFRITLLI